MAAQPLARMAGVKAASLAGALTEIIDGRQVLRPTPIQAVDRVLVRLELAWEEAVASPPIVRSSRMVQVIESFARYTGVEMAAKLLNSGTPIGETWKERLCQAGWTPPPGDEVLPGLPRPETSDDLGIEGATIIDLEVPK